MLLLRHRKLAGLGVPMLRTLFNQVFGEPTASNNASWLRRKLSESPDVVHGQRRSAIVRARDMGAAIWNSPIPVVTVGGCEDGGLISPDADGCAGDRVMGQDCLEFDDNTAADADDAGHALLVRGPVCCCMGASVGVGVGLDETTGDRTELAFCRLPRLTISACTV